MRIKTCDREMICLMIALNNLPPEKNHQGRKSKERAFRQLELEKLEESANRQGDMLKFSTYSLEPRVVKFESAVYDYLIEKFGGEGQVLGGPFVERSIVNLVDKLRETKDTETETEEKKDADETPAEKGDEKTG